MNEYGKMYSLNREKGNKMLEGFAYTVPTIGRISIGEVVDGENGRLPQKHDYFSITTQVQAAGKWVPHPLHAELESKLPKGNKGEGEGGGTKKLREIPIRLMYNNPNLNFRENYTAFGKNGRPVCVGNGKDARRVNQGVVETVGCPGADICEFGRNNRCKPFGRLNVQIDGQDDPFSTFIFRTSGFNSIRILRQKLQSMFGALNGKLVGIPLSLKLRARSSRMSHGTAFYVADITLRDGMSIVAAMDEGKKYRDELAASGFNQGWMEKEASKCLDNGRFEDAEEDFLEFEEFLIGDDLESVGKSGVPETHGKHEGRSNAKQGDPLQFENAGLGMLANDLKTSSKPVVVKSANIKKENNQAVDNFI